MKLIDKDALVAEIDKHLSYYKDLKDRGILSKEGEAAYRIVRILKSDINSLEVKEVDLEKLGEIARHFIAVKENIEDMRLDSSEWNLLEKIGYPERFKAQEGE